MSRTVALIDGEVSGTKAGNPNWLADAGDKALITALTNEKNQLGEFKCSFHAVSKPFPCPS